MKGVCDKCGKKSILIQGIGSKGYYCSACHKKFEKNNIQRKLKKEFNLEKCFNYNKTDFVIKKKDKKNIDNIPAKKIWYDNFRNDFPNFNSYLGCMRSWKIDVNNVIEIKKKIDELDEKLKTSIIFKNLFNNNNSMGELL